MSRLLALLLLLVATPAFADGVLRSAHVLSPTTMQITIDGALDTTSVRVAEAAAPDVPLSVTHVEIVDAHHALLTVRETLSRRESYLVDARSTAGAAGHTGARPSRFALVFSTILAAALINNFVFTRYLGLCIFFGVSKKRDTSIGMGATFTIVMLATGMLSWAVHTFVLRPLHLGFLQVVVFIGMVAFIVQMLDTILKKVQPSLHKRFGIYLVLITTNCIILAVPLLNAQINAGPLDALALALGSGLGFAAALFLMSCAREKAEFARVPKPFQGLPIAFALAGLFALAFMGFAGLDLFR